MLVAIGRLLGAIDISGLSNGRLSVFFEMLLAGFLPMFIKNIFEELSWRGYLAPRVRLLGMSDLTGHAIVGFIWGIWHLPYYLGLLDSSLLREYTSLPLVVFIPLMIVGLMAASIIYGEIRILTGSVWPAVLMHTVSNVLINTMILEGFLIMNSGLEILVSPSMVSLLGMLLIAAVGIRVYRRRLASARQSIS